MLPNIENILKGKLALIAPDTPLYSVHVAKSDTGKKYRMIYQVTDGFIQVEVNHNEIEEIIISGSQQEFTKKDSEELIILDKDPKAMEVY